MAVVVVAVCATTAVVAPPPAQAAPGELDAALVVWRQTRDEVVELDAMRVDLTSRIAAIDDELVIRRNRHSQAVAVREDLLDSMGAQAVEVYLRQPTDLDQSGQFTSQLLLDQHAETLNVATARRDSAAAGIDGALARQRKAAALLDDTTTELSAATSALNDATGGVTQLMGAVAVDVVVLDAVVTTRDWVTANRPGCALPVAVVAGMAQASTAVGASFPVPVSGLLDFDPVGPVAGDGLRRVGVAHAHPLVWLQTQLGIGGEMATNSVYDSMVVAAAWLCDNHGDLDRYRGLSAALWAWSGDSVWGERAMAAGRRFNSADWGLGVVPLRPSSGAGLQIADGDRLADADVAAMLWWARGRVGTPYSQCIGRPQDPQCPPGANRYGDGFFDCSGFVAAAYARIGVVVPLTTYAMEADAGFMSTKVADRPDLAVMVPGDVLLMDGHVAMWWGEGKIIHSSSGGLQIEPLPAYMMRDVFAVLRPV